ncbi:hypothetical protein J8I87_30065 [Paraburkholderia sp. LEh10]|uniref:hypothetical protein n=1 Tax=Paraburkholderia sp. LEh10 TaxID=2821353 RepID=UPI001AE38595|nr:hypothetical protein [Paraburkholderia sp. LEh10]MBP0593853.1 hypothetical protein [Paraburkholderia sp. LEh10]
MRIRAAGYLAAAATLSAMASATPAAASHAPFGFDGIWRVTRIVGYSEVSVSPDRAHRLVGQTVTIGPRQLRIGDDDCVPDAMHADTRATAPVLLDRYHAGPADAGVPARTLMLDAGQCGHVFRIGADIVVYQGGVFYRASRVKPADKRR